MRAHQVPLCGASDAKLGLSCHVSCCYRVVAAIRRMAMSSSDGSELPTLSRVNCPCAWARCSTHEWDVQACVMGLPYLSQICSTLCRCYDCQVSSFCAFAFQSPSCSTSRSVNMRAAGACFPYNIPWQLFLSEITEMLHLMQGFGQVSCPACGGKGLTPEQRGER